MDLAIPVPDSLAAPGRHLLALRISTFHLPASLVGYVYSAYAGSYQAMANRRSRLMPLVFLGGFLIIGVFYGVLFGLDRRRLTLLLVSSLCFSVVALLMAESWREALGYTTDVHIVRLWLVTGLTGLVSLLLAGTFLVQFRVPRRGWWAGLLIASMGAALFVPGFDTKSLFVIGLGLAVALGATGWALVRRKTGAGWAFAGVAVCTATLSLTGLGFLDAYFFPAFAFLVACLLAALGRQIRDERQRLEAERLTSARLEVELLKKQLQPHFMMNSLTSVIEWMESDPKAGVRFVEALAGELRLLAEVSGERLIPVERELALCASLLDVMRYRTDIVFELDTAGIRPADLIPPALFHTLVENGITHSTAGPSDSPVRFRLTATHADGRVRYVFDTPHPAPSDHPDREGTGLRYVRARLTESFGTNWTLTAGLHDGMWRVVVRFAQVESWKGGTVGEWGTS
ncbi:MAG: histidine kinase, partial [Bacteroidota bacterium]